MNPRVKTFTVTVEFDEDVVFGYDINTVAENILSGLVSQVNTAGLTPEDSEAITQHIVVESKETGDKFEHHF